MSDYRKAQQPRTSRTRAGKAPAERRTDQAARADVVELGGRWVRVEMTLDDPHGLFDAPSGLTLWADRAFFWAENLSLPISSVLRLDAEQLRLRVVPAPSSAVTLLGRAYAVRHAAFLPGGPADLNFLGRVQLDPDPKAGAAYVRGTITAGPLRLVEPSLLFEPDDARRLLDRLWPGGVIRQIVLTAGALQMEVVQTASDGSTVHRRIAYRGAWMGEDVSVRIWEAIACPDSPDVADPADRLQEVITDITNLLTTDLQVPIQLAAGGAAPGVYYRVTRTTSAGKTTSRVDELLRPGVTLRFAGPDGTVTEWVPATLTVSQQQSPQDTQYLFSNVDEISALIDSGQRADDRIPSELVHVVANWVKPAHPGDPSVFLSQAPPLYASGAADPTFVVKNYLWQPVRPVPKDGSAAWSGLPPAWARYRVGDVPFTPGAIGLDRPRLPNWSGPLTLLDERTGADLATHWRIVLDMEDLATVSLRVAATISHDGGVALDLVGPQTLAYSPGMKLRSQDATLALDDPGSVPAPLVYDDELETSSLVFQHDGEVVDGPPALESLRVEPCLTGAVPFQLSAGRDAARFYPIAEDALIDPASATGGNLRAVPADRLVVLSGVTPADALATRLPVDKRTALQLTDAYKGLDVRVNPAGGPAQTHTVTGFSDDGTGAWGVTVDPKDAFVLPLKAGTPYALVVSQSTLPRDPNHGLVPQGLMSFTWEPATGTDNKPRLTGLRFDVTSLQGGSLPSVMALAPWVEWGSMAPNWLTTSLARLHHRNLVLEHPEMEVALEDRTPDGPTGSGAQPAPVLPYRDVIRAVRDRYTQASGNNLLASDNAEHTIRNWLPWADWVDQRNQPLAPRLDFQPATAASAPAVTLSAVGDSPQVLSIDPTVGGTNFLELDIGAEPFAVSRPTLILAAPERGDGPTSGRSRAVNSGAPLVFSPQCVASLASLGPSADNPTPLVLVGRADGTVVLTSWNKLVNQFEVAARFPAGARAVTGVALDASNNTLSIAASNKDKSARLWTMPAPGGLLVLSRFRGSIVPASTTTTFPHPDEVTCIALDGPWLLTGCADGQARLWKVDQPAAPVKIIAPAAVPGPPPAVTAVGMALQGTTSTLLVADASGELRRFDRNDASSTPSPLQMIPDPLGRSLPLRLLAIDKSSGKVATGVGDTQLFFWSPRSATDGTLSLTTTDSGFPASLASVYGPDAGLAVAHGVEPGETPILVGGTDAIARVHAVGAPGIDRVVLDCRGSEVSAVVALSDGLGGGWLVAGTTAGTLQAWSLADDSEVANPFPDAAQTGAIYDNLGVVRSALPVNPGGPWVVEQLLGPDGAALISVTYAAADTSAAPLFLVEPDSAGSPRYRTELRLACAALKLAGGAKGDVVVPPHGSNFEVAPFTLGAYSLWSAAENDPTSRFGQARYWPRLGGAPVFPTRLKQLVLDPIGGAAGWQAAALTYEAALINPLELTADGPSDRVLPSVRDAVARGSVVTVSLTSTANVAAVTLADGANALFDWAFDVDDQPDPQAGAFPGKLARLAGTVAVTQGRVVLTVDPARSAALVFGRLWPLALAAPLTLVTEAIVSNGQAVGVAYRAAGAPAGVALDIVQDEAAGPSLSFSLPVALPPAIGTGYLLGATVATQIDQDGTTVAALALTLRNNKDWPAGVVQPLNAALTEGGVFGFVLDPAVAPVAGATPLNGVLVLWNEGDPASPTLGGVLVSEELRPKVPAQLDPAGWKLVGDRLEMTIVASVVDPAGAIQWYQRQVWSWALGPDPATPPPVALNLLINEQTAKGAQSFVTAYVDVSTGATPMPRIQGPVRLMLKADDGSLLKWNAGLAHARAVAPPVVAPDRLTDLEFPMASGTVRAFTLAEAVEQTSLSSSDPVAAFVQLVIDAAGVSLFKVLEDQVPLDLCLEPDAVAPPTLLPPSVPQLVHRAVFGGQLRVALWPPDQALDPPQSNLPFDPGTHSWLLSPVGPADRGCVLNSQRLWLSETATGDDLRTEDVLVLFREVAGPDATAAREVRAAGGPRPLPSVVSVLSGTAVNTDDPLFPAERVRAAVLQAGATGMVVRRTLQLGGLARYDFEPSPFVGSSQAATAVFLTSTPGRLVASPPATPPTIDQRLIAPEVVRSWTIADAPAYALRSMSFDPYREDACAPARALEFSRRGPAVPSLSKPTGSGAPALACRVAEVPAFQEAAPLWYVPRELPPTPTGRNQFLPCNVRLRFGPDKPGAMVQHLITPLAAQPMKGDPPRWTLGPTTELALREPQRIKVSDCVTAGVTVLDATLTAGAFPDDLRRLSVHWNELIGRVTFDARPLPATTSQLLLRAGSAYRFSSTPFLAVVQFDQTVFALRPDDKTLPIYQLEAGGNTVRRAPRIFLITRLPNLGNPIDFDDGTGPLHFQPYVVVKSSQPLKPDGNALLGELFQQVAVGGGGSDGLIVWEYSPTADAAKRPESPDADVFQFVWMATDSKGAVWSAPYASGPVVLNPLGASPLLPKLAAVVSQFPPPAGSPPLARTAFFGDAAPPDQAAPRFEKVAPLYNFVLEVSDLRETVQFTRRPGDGSATFRLDLIKYLVPGQVVSGSSSVKSPTRLILRNVYEHRGDR